MSVAPVLQILTANRLADGLAVFCRSDGSWTPDIHRAAGASGAESRRDLERRGERAVADRHVVEPYLIDVVETGGTFEPVRLRERIRASGPTVTTRPAVPTRAYAAGD